MPAADTDPVMLFDRRAWRRHRERAARHGPVDFLHADIALRLIERLDHVGRAFPMALDLGVQNGVLARRLAARQGVEQVVWLDPAIGFLAGRAGWRVAVLPAWLLSDEHSIVLVASTQALHGVDRRGGFRIELLKSKRRE